MLCRILGVDFGLRQVTPEELGEGEAPAEGEAPMVLLGLGRVVAFVPPLIHFIPDSLTYSVPLFLKRRCDRTLGLWRRPAHPRHVLAPRGKGGAGRGQARRGAAALAAGLAGHQRRRPARGLPADAGLQASQRAQGRRAAPAGRVYYPIVTSQNSSTTLYQVSHRIQQLFS